MYVEFFQLSEAPFSIAPDPRYLFMSGRHREALAHLLYGVQSGGGFVLLTGEIGAGKTTVCRCFLEQIPADCDVAYIFNPRLTVWQLLDTICQEFHITPVARYADSEEGGDDDARKAMDDRGASLPANNDGSDEDTEATLRTRASAPRPSLRDHVDALNARLLQTHSAGRSSVLIIDEAQNLSADVLEQLRLLTNLETNSRKLLQIVLIGQPELRDMVARSDLRQLAQRISARYHLESLSAPETVDYVQHRLAVAGMAGRSPFSPARLRQIHRLTGGVPRRINLLCDRSLLGAYAQDRRTVDRATVARAARELAGTAGRSSTGWRHAASLGLAMALVVFGAAGIGLSLAGKAGQDVVAWMGNPAKLFGNAKSESAVKPLEALVENGLAGAALGGSPHQAKASASAAANASASPRAAAAPSTMGATSALTAGTGSPAATPTPAASSTASSASIVPTTSPASATAGSSGSPVATGVAAAAELPELLALRPRPVAAAAMRGLAGLWGAKATGDPAPACAALKASNLRCHAGRGGLAELRRLDRPALIGLRDDAGRDIPVLLTALSATHADLQANGVPYRIGVNDLTARIRPEFLTLWRQPKAFRDRLVLHDHGPDVDWLTSRLAEKQAPHASAVGIEFDAALVRRVQAFQAAEGLTPDGVVGPRTFMLLNAAAGIVEPSLHSEPRAGSAAAVAGPAKGK